MIQALLLDTVCDIYCGFPNKEVGSCGACFSRGEGGASRYGIIRRV